MLVSLMNEHEKEISFEIVASKQASGCKNVTGLTKLTKFIKSQIGDMLKFVESLHSKPCVEEQRKNLEVELEEAEGQDDVEEQDDVEDHKHVEPNIK
ncbi:hypothetical protein QVD17_35155 [Tagetes erecta]|uniref:Uncharacterized protein n=1 Tax=Tagetes erecta TaxID=13708 RepID=A0AAD8K0D4_TARER|nr:hypothetical protein QVD17_35155 [Tagetes erecta]